MTIVDTPMTSMLDPLRAPDPSTTIAGSLLVDATGRPDTASKLATPSVLWKAFGVLDTFSASRRVLSLADITRRSGLPKSTVHRVLGMLLEVGAVERHGDGYRLGIRMVSIAACSTELGVRDVALPYLEELHRVTGQTLHMAVLRGPDVVYVEKLRARRAIDTPAVVGGRLSAHCTAVGKAMLAFTEPAPLSGPLSARTAHSITTTGALVRELDRIRSSGIAVDHQEAQPGLSCIAAPVLLRDRAIAAVSVAYPARAGNADRLVASLRRTATSVSRALFTSPGYAAAIADVS